MGFLISPHYRLPVGICEVPGYRGVPILDGVVMLILVNLSGYLEELLCVGGIVALDVFRNPSEPLVKSGNLFSVAQSEFDSFLPFVSSITGQLRVLSVLLVEVLGLSLDELLMYSELITICFAGLL